MEWMELLVSLWTGFVFVRRSQQWCPSVWYVSVCSFVSALRGRIVGDLLCGELVISGSVEVSFVKKNVDGIMGMDGTRSVSGIC
jgi:hypothetical protein